MKLSSLRFSAACLGLVFLLPRASLAHESDAHDERGHRPTDYNMQDKRSPQYAAFEFRVGPYEPDVDEEFGGGAAPYEDSFGTKPSVSPGIELDWQALRIPYFGTLGPGVGWHWFRKGGIAPFTDGTEGSAHTNSLRIMPMYAVAVLRVDVFQRQFHVPLVPYVKGGFAWAFWKSRDAGNLTVVNGEKGKGLEIGWQVQAGLMLQLNPLAPQMAIDMDNAGGVNNAYLFLEGWLSEIDSFGTGMEVGDTTWVGGVALEF